MLDQAKRAARAALEAWRRAASASHVRQSRPHVTRAALTAGLARLGIAPGDTLFVHSSLKSLGYVEGGAPAVIGALQDAVGSQGTLLLPTYYLPGGTVRATCAMPDYVFDPRRHGTHMGRLPEAFLASAGVRRSIHPTHSVSAWGRHAIHLTEAHHRAPSIFGMDSPWQRFIGCEHAKVLGLGISMGPVTFYHALEDAMGGAFPVPVWEDDTKLLACLDHAGRRWEVPVRPFDQAVAQRRIDHPGRGDLRDYFHREFDTAGLRVNGQVGDAASWCIPAQAFYAHLGRLASDNVTIYASAAQLAARPIGRA
ncbi:aminoglycoside 3-N-acetyltransferase [Janthinobacterium sp. 67]|uniref:AAC(3) family N-acetyltransferase n=1 Tax=Janthinobacterium sp. 67 TaxID=2035207 RepID=UPI000C2311A9|nr:AAC(3) family N-acetyltransferase [Janthinobacterium sp. 67]PJJ18258.1 aminoglycoside 3-N-acetyltransferase [Janthinobacterium sp. 67]